MSKGASGCVKFCGTINEMVNVGFT